jgi:hypothetical protein
MAPSLQGLVVPSPKSPNGRWLLKVDGQTFVLLTPSDAPTSTAVTSTVVASLAPMEKDLALSGLVALGLLVGLAAARTAIKVGA